MLLKSPGSLQTMFLLDQQTLFNLLQLFSVQAEEKIKRKKIK